MARRLAEEKAETRRLEQERFAAEGGLADQPGIKRQEGDKIEQGQGLPRSSPTIISLDEGGWPSD